MFENNLIHKNVRSETLKMSSADLAAWDRRIQSTEWHLKEELVSPAGFDMLCEKATKTIFNIVEEPRNESLIRALQNAITELTLKQRKIIYFIFWEGLSEQQIAFAVKLPRTTVSCQKASAFRQIFEKVRPKILSYEGTSFKTSNPASEIRPQSGCLTEHKITGVKNEL